MFRKAKVIYLVCLLVFGSSIGSFAADNNIDDATKARVHENYGKLPLSFIQNDGQKDNKVKFYERGSGHSTYFTTDGIYLELISDKKINAEAINTKDNKQIIPESKTTKSKNQVQQTAGGQNLKSEIIKLTPIGANKNPKIIAEKEQKGRVNYFIGNDPKKWKTNIPTYEVVVYKDIYKGIDMKFYGNNRQMEYDIIVKPGADPLLVRLSYEGIEGLSVTKDGKMEIALKEGTVVQNKPYCYQEIDGKKVEVGGEFRVLRAEGKMQKATGEYGKERTHTEDGHKQRFVYNFHIASYDKSHPLIIDPVLTYSTYLGGSNIDSGNGIAVDTSGNAYVTGNTYSTDFPMVSAFDGSHNGSENVFVTKLDASGTSLTYSTYLGGGDMDSGSGIAVDTSGNAYVTGSTESTNFPTLKDYQGNQPGWDAFVTKTSCTPSRLPSKAETVGKSVDSVVPVT